MASANTSALITLEEGAVSVELLKSELARIILVRWDWSVQEHGDKAFLVPFPSKVELDSKFGFLLRMFLLRSVLFCPCGLWGQWSVPLRRWI